MVSALSIWGISVGVKYQSPGVNKVGNSCKSELDDEQVGTCSVPQKVKGPSRCACVSAKIPSSVTEGNLAIEVYSNLQGHINVLVIKIHTLAVSVNIKCHLSAKVYRTFMKNTNYFCKNITKKDFTTSCTGDDGYLSSQK